MNDGMDELLNGCADKDDLSCRGRTGGWMDGWMDDTPRNPLVKGNFHSIFSEHELYKINLSDSIV